jgi:hypothetical protein
MRLIAKFKSRENAIAAIPAITAELGGKTSALVIDESLIVDTDVDYTTRELEFWCRGFELARGGQMKTEYRIETSRCFDYKSAAEQLARIITPSLEAGWKPQGGVSMTTETDPAGTRNFVMAQALIKQEVDPSTPELTIGD